MAEKFDPYYKWLGIPPKDQPPHHYRLLGIELFEPDRDVIDAAANRLMGYLKELAAGDDASHSQKLLNEISRARLCLLNKDKKAAYDQELRAKLPAERGNAAAPAPQAPPPPQISAPVVPPAIEPPAFVTPPIITEPPRIDIGPAATGRDTGLKPPPLTARGPAAAGGREVREFDGFDDEEDEEEDEFDEEDEGEEEYEDDDEPYAKPRRSSQTRMYLIATGLAALGLALLIVVILLLPPPGSPTKTGRQKTKPRHTGPNPVLVLLLSDDVRQEVTAFQIDGQPQECPPKTELALEPGTHRLMLRRPGYEEVVENILLVSGQQRKEFRPSWRAQGGARP